MDAVCLAKKLSWNILRIIKTLSHEKETHRSPQSVSSSSLLLTALLNSCAFATRPRASFSHTRSRLQ